MIARALTRQSNEPEPNDLSCAYPSFDLIGRRLELGTKDLGSQRDTKEWQAVGQSREQ